LRFFEIGQKSAKKKPFFGQSSTDMWIFDLNPKRNLYMTLKVP